MGIGTTVKTGLKALSETKGGKAVITGAGVGGGVALAGAGVGGGVNLLAGGIGDGISKIAEANPLNGVVESFGVSKEASKGIGSVLGIAILVGIALLIVFVIIPKIGKNKRGRK